MNDLKAQHPDYYKLAERFHVIGELRERVNTLAIQVTLSQEYDEIDSGLLKAEKKTLLQKRNDLAHDPKLDEWLEKASRRTDGLSDTHLENLKLIQSSVFENHALPFDPEGNDMIEQLKEQHAKHKESGNFDAIRELFATKVRYLQGRMNDYKQAYNTQPEHLRDDKVTSRYDAMLRIKESDARAEFIKSFSDNIGQKFTPALAGLRKKQSENPPQDITRDIAPEAKLSMVKEILETISPDDFNKCQFYASSGSSVSNTQDQSIIRIKTKPASPVTVMTSALHEFGHALYFLNTDAPEGLEDLPKQPVTYKRGSTTSEGAAYALQMAITLPEFWEFAGPIVRHHYGVEPGDSDAKAFSNKNLHKLATYLDPQPKGNRLQSDQISRLPHLAMRDRLERELMDGDIEPEDFDAYWGVYLKEYVGIETESAEDSCMQDVHFFKFPKFYGFAFYATGLVFGENALQLSIRNNAEIPSQMAKGNFAPLVSQYKQDYFRHGAQYPAEVLLEKAGGKKELDIDLFLNGITERYQWNEGKSTAPHTTPKKPGL